jgi:para-nitrobenzyl esterase
LGVLAHLDLSQWSDDHPDSANVGTCDQLLALRWVREHIASFGGNPGNVTLFGQSGGGMKATTMYGVPSASGLYHRVACQSAGDFVYFERDEAAQVADRTLHLLGVPSNRVDRLAGVDLERLLQVQSELESVASFPSARGAVRARYRPVVDGDLLVATPLDALARGAGASVPLLVGTTRDEASTLYFRDLRTGTVDEHELLGRLAAFGASAPDVVAGYRRRRPGARPIDLLVAIQSDVLFRLNAVRLADAQSTGGGAAYTYRFDWPTPVFGGVMGAAHCLEIPFVFDVVDDVPAAAHGGDDARRLGWRVSEAWAAFARQGAPVATQLPPWPAWSPGDGPTMLLDRECRVVGAPWLDDHALLTGATAAASWNVAAVGRSEPARPKPAA